jgi:hypothetical protein
MGLSAFSRARVSQLPEMELEAKRFDDWNKMHQGTTRAVDDFREKAEEDVEKIRETMLEDVAVIGEKVVAGLQENTPEGEPVDLPLRLDHVADMVGRRHVEDPQGEPKSTLERLHDRIPTEAPASEVIVHKTDVETEGPTKEEMDAAYEEQEPWVEEPVPDQSLPEPEGEEDGEEDESGTRKGKDSREKVELPAAGSGAGVKGNKVDAPVTAKPTAAPAAKPATGAAKGPATTVKK